VGLNFEFYLLLNAVLWVVVVLWLVFRKDGVGDKVV
jgi:hypothetical protein